MRILLGWAWTYLIVAELIGEKSGITAYIQQQGRYFNFDKVYAGIILIGLLGLRDRPGAPGARAPALPVGGGGRGRAERCVRAAARLRGAAARAAERAGAGGAAPRAAGRDVRMQLELPSYLEHARPRCASASRASTRGRSCSR